MKNLRFLAIYAVCITGLSWACGSSDSNPITSGDNGDAGEGGAGASSGGNAGNANGGSSSGRGGATNGGGGSSGASGSGASSGDGGVAGDAGGPSEGGTSGTSGAAGDGGGGAGGGGGGMCPDPVHPNVNGNERTCNADFCYCADDDGCYPEAVASSCCGVAVVCGPGAMNPVATINHPGDGEPPRDANDLIPFIGEASDPQDGALTGAALVWTSSELSAPFGTGTSFEAMLPAGTHVITLTATDSDSNTGTDTITLTVQ